MGDLVDVDAVVVCYFFVVAISALESGKKAENQGN